MGGIRDGTAISTFCGLVPVVLGTGVPSSN
jgi:hypothetical protein